SKSDLPPVARIAAANCDELPSFNDTLAPVFFSKDAMWQVLESSAKEPPKMPTTSSSAWAAQDKAAATKPAAMQRENLWFMGTPNEDKALTQRAATEAAGPGPAQSSKALYLSQKINARHLRCVCEIGWHPRRAITVHSGRP
ncbi:MAG: hypothetical protein V4636_20670, partial [Pseudomonadota bacterium]